MYKSKGLEFREFAAGVMKNMHFFAGFSLYNFVKIVRKTVRLPHFRSKVTCPFFQTLSNVIDIRKTIQCRVQNQGF